MTPQIRKRRDPKPTTCLRCGTDDYEPSYRTPYCVACRKMNNREATRDRMRAMRAVRREFAELEADGDTLIGLVGSLNGEDAASLVDGILTGSV
jgi:ribosomal protein L37E